MTIFVLLDLLVKIVTLFVSLKTHLIEFSCKKHKRTLFKQKISEGTWIPKPDTFHAIYFHTNSEAYGILIPVIDFMAVELQGKFSSFVVYIEEGLKHQTCFKHGLK